MLHGQRDRCLQWGFYHAMPSLVKVSDHVRLVIYSYLTPKELVTRIAQLSANERALLPQSALLGRVTINLRLTQQLTKRKFQAIEYLLLLADELHLTIKLQGRLVGYEHEDEAASFIERIMHFTKRSPSKCPTICCQATKAGTRSSLL